MTDFQITDTDINNLFALSAFGESDNPETFFTGKPRVEGLGHTFLFRNYRASLAKWQTTDPLGYPDGWNQLVYCNNGVTSAVDLWGGVKVIIRSANSSALESVVHAIDIMVVSDESVPLEGGEFRASFGTMHYDLEENQRTFYVDLTIGMSPSMKFDSDYKEVGDITMYAPHTGSADNSKGVNNVYEAIYAYELAHAQYFINNGVAALEAELEKNNADQLLLSLSSARRICNACIETVFSNFAVKSNRWANQAVYDWFAAHDFKWEQIHDVGDFKQWRVME